MTNRRSERLQGAVLNRSLLVLGLGLFSSLKHVLHFHVRQFHAVPVRWSVIFMFLIFSAPTSIGCQFVLG